MRASDLLGLFPNGAPIINVNLLLTRRCNYECRHCMYAAGPKMPAAYMQPDTLGQIIEAMRQVMQELSCMNDFYAGTLPDFNLVGGEPTLDLEQFAHCVDYLARNGASIETTTNGWWLEQPDTLRKFLRAVRGKDIRIRISDSAHHRLFRSARLQHLLKLLRSKDTCYEIYDTLTEHVSTSCPVCSQQGTREDMHGHREDCEVQEDELQDAFDHAQECELAYYYVEELAEMVDSYTLFVDRQHGDADHISPVGRAKNYQIAATQDGSCGLDSGILRFTFQPDGSIYDFCCNGGKVAGGHARDGSQLLYNNIDFMQTLFRAYPRSSSTRNNPLAGARCRNCSSVARNWK